MILPKTAHLCSVILCCLLVTACNDKADIADRQTLKVMDDTSQLQPLVKKKVDLSKSESDIRDAYINYLEHSSTQDLSRSDALNRLANIEFKLSEQLLAGSEDEQFTNQMADQKLNRVIELLETSLTDYPDARSNDVSLYQLAKAYDQKGEYEQTHITLQELAEKHPKSKFYLEAQFRLAEYAFTKRQYISAEDKYTEIIIARNNGVFFEKALYKRGWSRFKQEFYLEAADDFVRVINKNNFSDYEKLTVSQKNLFDEYFRALALSFSYLGGAEQLNTYLQDSEYADNDYYVYRSLSAVFLKQQQYNDAVKTLKSFIAYNEDSKYAPQASLKTIDIWKEAGFIEKRAEAFESFYKIYHPQSAYWKNQQSIDKQEHDKINLALKDHILTETATYHKLYQQSKKPQDFLHAQRWYLNYLKHFQLYARQDNIHFLLASLYSSQGDEKQAIKYYQLAAFDDQTIINKQAAYHSILIASSLHSSSSIKAEKALWLTKLIEYSTLYAQQYPTDKNTLKVIAYASTTAYNNQQYNNAISLAELAVSDNSSAMLTDINTTKANGYFHTKQYEIAESAYLALINSKGLNKKQKKELRKSLSLAIYYQGNLAIENKQIDQAISHYSRIIEVAPNTEAASSGLYDAIALSIEHKQWLASIRYIKTFRKRYPNHKYSTDVTKKLSVAYLNSKQNVAAAKELEKLSSKESSVEYKMASLLKAAQLYQADNENKAAIRSYEKYAKNYKKPFPAYQEALFQLASLTTKTKQLKSSKKMAKANFIF
ncbi:MAG: tetratricopeptide repeat protein [Psychromonas sp.]|nr:tetratricopeptide repeat protein [Psychromonas sp.]